MNDAQVEEINRHCGVVAESHSGIRRDLQEMHDEFRDKFEEPRALMCADKTGP